MGQIILHPEHPDYCIECIYHDNTTGACKNKRYQAHIYEVNCVWRYCRYKRTLSSAENEEERK